jgi:hypothetical protein
MATNLARKADVIARSIESNFCDGTGVEIPEDTPTTGHFGRQYCEAARADAEEYLRLIDEAHTAAARLYEMARETLRGVYRLKLATLPDEPQ